MPQISLYVDEETLRKVESAAQQRHISISKWVSEQIRSKLEPIYPLGFEDLYGSVAPDEIQRPSQGSLEQDAIRERL